MYANISCHAGRCINSRFGIGGRIEPGRQLSYGLRGLRFREFDGSGADDEKGPVAGADRRLRSIA
jgi:hypothetical protein